MRNAHRRRVAPKSFRKFCVVYVGPALFCNTQFVGKDALPATYVLYAPASAVQCCFLRQRQGTRTPDMYVHTYLHVRVEPAADSGEQGGRVELVGRMSSNLYSTK